VFGKGGVHFFFTGKFTLIRCSWRERQVFDLGYAPGQILAQRLHRHERSGAACLSSVSVYLILELGRQTDIDLGILDAGLHDELRNVPH
jgi:hypothetical protein